jgi:spore coat protein A, manganese oxidase
LGPATRAGQAGGIVVGWAAGGAKLGSLPARQLAIVLSAYASLLHDWVLPEHYRDWWGYGLFFLVAAVAQAFYAGMLLLWPRRWVCLVGIAGNTALLGLYMLTRTLGVPFVPLLGPYAGTVEPVGVPDLASAAAEVGLVLILVRLVVKAPHATRVAPLSKEERERETMLSRWTISRRDLMKLSAVGVGSVLLPAVRLGQGLADGQRSSPPVPLFQLRLPSPPLATPVGTTTVMTPSGVTKEADVFELTARVGLAQVLPPPFSPTQIWGYNGLAPGPLFRVRSGRPVVVRHTNGLTTADTGSIELGLSTHLHGGNVDGFSDGHPFNKFETGTSKQYTYFNEQPAVTMWYHDHAIDHTARNVYHGLASFYLLSDEHEDSLNLPSGEFDVPVLIQSKFFNADGSLNFPPGDHPEDAPNQGILGDTIVVNGAAWPFMEVQRRQYRFRFLNGSNAREFLLALDSGQPFLQIGTEGGLVPRAVNQPTIHITPAERYEVIIDFSVYPPSTTTVVLQNLLESGNLRNIMQFRLLPGAAPQGTPVVAGQPLMSADLLAKFNVLQALAARVRAGGPLPPEIAGVRNFRMERGNGAFQINKKGFDLNVDDATPRAGTFELLNLQNDSGGWFHPNHLHLLHAGFGLVVIDRNGEPITPTDQEFGWKETVNIGRNNESVRVITLWPDVPVNPTNASQPQVAGQRTFDFFQRRYVFHCHNVDHEDHDMMAQFRVDH